MKYYNRTKEECVKLGCKCVDCLSNHHNEKYCCNNCSRFVEVCGTKVWKRYDLEKVADKIKSVI